MVGPDLRVSEESIPLLAPYASLALRDPRRRELFAFLAAVVDRPQDAPFEPDEEGVRWTWLDHVGVAWWLDLVNHEIEVLKIWDLATG